MEIYACFRRTQWGITELQLPIVVSQYNKYMAGVYLADTRRINWDETGMVLNQWWLELLLYFLVVCY